MTVFTATFSGVATSAAQQDMFEITAPDTSRVVVHDIVLAQYSDFDPSTETEIISLTILRGHANSGSGGQDITTTGVSNLNPYGRQMASTVERHNTTVASGGTPETLWADMWHLQAGFIWRLSERMNTLGTEGKILLKPAQRLVVRISAPADPITANGTLLFEEIGQVPA